MSRRNQTLNSQSLPPWQKLSANFPAALLQRVKDFWNASIPEAVQTALISNEENSFFEKIVTALSHSEFVCTILKREPALLLECMPGGDFQNDIDRSELNQRLVNCLVDVSDETSLMSAIRRFRNRQMLRIAMRDLMGLADLSVTMQELSQCADVIIQKTLDKLTLWQITQSVEPGDRTGSSQRLYVLAMGKLGGQELNFSSDVDLIFAYAHPGETQLQYSNEQFFSRLAQRLIHVLQTVTDEGFVYRVDMRLRPFGDGGPLVMSFSAIAAYYQEHGRDWERYALQKARIIQPDKVASSFLSNLLKPFVYRRYLDYGSIESLREMKRLIQREVTLQNLQEDIKRGPGGIRQIEFIGQVFQLIRGGQERRLQQRKILLVLRFLKDSQTLLPNVVDELVAAYVFLRNVEHRLQMVRDSQTHLLPKDPVNRWQIAHAMGFEQWDDFFEVIQNHRLNVENHFEKMLMHRQDVAIPCDGYVEADVAALWGGTLSNEEALALLKKMGVSEATEILQMIETFHDSYRCRQLQGQAKERLGMVMPRILQAITLVKNAKETLFRVIHLLESIVRRSAYLSLLLENPDAIIRMVKIFSESPWAAERIASFPFLLDEMTVSQVLKNVSAEERLEDSLRQQLIGIPETDLEEQMESLRRFKLQHELRAALAELEVTLPLIKVSDQLSFIASVLLRQAQEMVVKELLAKSQYASDIYSENSREFAIIAYGKLGGLEMSYHSDLDLVFLHDMSNEDEFPIRLAQRLIHLLNTRMSNGILYQVDTRLRPSGSAGLLVSRIDAFIEYQQETAWTWEHQALVRSRVISAGPRLRQRFNEARLEILTRVRDPSQIRKDVIDMRDKMLATHRVDPLQFDLKNDPGGIIDIEFIVQLGVLIEAHHHPEVAKWSDTIRILEALGDCGCFTPSLSQELIRIYLQYRAEIHYQILHSEAISEAPPKFEQERATVLSVWREFVIQVAAH